MKQKVENNMEELDNIKEVEKANKDNSKKSSDCSCDEDEDRFRLLKILLSGGLFILGIVLNINAKYKFFIFLVAYLIVGFDVILNALKNIVKGKVFDETFLMSIATIGAFAIGESNEAVAVMLFYTIGEYLQDKAVDHSRKSISELMNIRPEYANLKLENKIEKVSPDKVKIGDIIVVKVGEKVPLDGIVVEGKSLLDTSAITGESIPREVKENSEVLSGMINTRNLISIKVTKTFENSTVSKILELVENTSSKKAKTEKFITKFAKIYTPIVVFIALLVAVIPPIILPGATLEEWIYKALICLVISCPCALVISIPLSYFGSIGCASKKGILIKGSNHIETLDNIDTVIFDKTGTLTRGVFKVIKIEPMKNHTKDEILKYCAYAEAFSNHPIATSILKEYNQEIDKTQIKDYEEIPGKGIKAKIYGKEVVVGNNELLKKEEKEGTIVHLSVDKEDYGYIVISDVIKESSKTGIEELRKLGIKKIMMFTGDNKLVAKKISEELGLDDFKAGLLPTQKVEELENLINKKSKLIFVGDGINDAPVLARADVGISMGGVGQDSAIEASDIVIMTDEISKIATTIKIAKKTKSIVIANIMLALIIKIIAIIMGILGIATIWQAVIADVGVTIVAVINSMRCLYIKEK